MTPATAYNESAGTPGYRAMREALARVQAGEA
jgi:hypothetical protein